MNITKVERDIWQEIFQSRKDSRLEKENELYSPIIKNEIARKSITSLRKFQEEVRRRAGINIIEETPAVMRDLDGGIDFFFNGKIKKIYGILNVSQSGSDYYFEFIGRKYKGALN